MLSSINFHPIFLIVIGSLMAIFGYKIQKLVRTITCFSIGFTLANLVTPMLLDNNLIIIIINIVVGIIISSLSIKLEKFAIGVTVAYLVYITLNSYANVIPYELTMLYQIVISLIVGIIAMILIKPLLILTTSICGGGILFIGVANYIDVPNNLNSIILLILIILCAIIQFKTN